MKKTLLKINDLNTLHKWTWLVMISCLIFLLQTNMTFASTRVDQDVSILLLNSYNDQIEWSNEVMSGINDAMDTYFPNAKVRIEYMDTKNISGDAYFEELYKTYRFKYDDQDFDAIISMDDNALKFILRYRDLLFKDVPVFFCGINLLENHNIEGQDHLYGLEEKSSPVETLSIAVKMNPQLKDVYVVVDNSITGQATVIALQKAVEASNLNLNLIFLNQLAFDDIVKEVGKIENQHSAVLYAFYNIDLNHESYTIKSTTERIVAASKVPVYGLWSFSYGYGIVGGKLISGYAHGERAVELAADFFHGMRYEDNQYVTSIDTNRYMYDYVPMKRFMFDMGKLPGDSIIINKPISFYEEHKEILHVSFALVVFLTLYIILLRRQVRHRTEALIKQEKKLMESERLAALGYVVSGVAHEVNTPLGNSIMLGTYIRKEIQKIIDSIENETITYTSFTKSIMQCNNSVDGLIKNLSKTEKIILDFKSVVVHYSSEDNHVFELKPYLENLGLLIGNTIKSDLMVDCEAGLFINTKQDHIFRILKELVDNSIEHGFEEAEEGVIQIKAWARDHVIIVEYMDDGKGIHAEFEKNVFAPFTTNRRSGGHTGLGLYAIYNLVTSIGGNIEYDANKNPGVRFVIELPRYN